MSTLIPESTATSVPTKWRGMPLTAISSMTRATTTTMSVSASVTSANAVMPKLAAMNTNVTVMSVKMNATKCADSLSIKKSDQADHFVHL